MDKGETIHIATYSKTEFLQKFVTRETINRVNYHFWNDFRKRKHVVLANGWTVPISIITALRRLFPGDTVVRVFSPFVDIDVDTEASEVALAFEHRSGRYRLYKSLVVRLNDETAP